MILEEVPTRASRELKRKAEEEAEEDAKKRKPAAAFLDLDSNISKSTVIFNVILEEKPGRSKSQNWTFRQHRFSCHHQQTNNNILFFCNKLFL